VPGRPTAQQWQFANDFTPDRLGYLERDASFEDIGRAIVHEARVTALPVEIGRDGDLRGCTRPVFRLVVDHPTFDQFHNGRDGYRGRYWQSPEIGEKANRWLLRELLPKLVDAPGATTNRAFAAKALNLGSAKIWFHEESSLGKARLFVEQWEQTASGESSLSNKARDGRWAPIGTTIEVKGAFMTDGGQERVDPDEVERAMVLHLAGHT
jgi:hypothetical protein